MLGCCLYKHLKILTISLWVSYVHLRSVECQFCCSRISLQLSWLDLEIVYAFRTIQSNVSNLFQLEQLRLTQNDQIHLIHNFSNLFPLKWLRLTWNSQFCPIYNFSSLFPPKWLRIIGNGQFHLIHNFFNLFPLKQLRITGNGQFC